MTGWELLHELQAMTPEALHRHVVVLKVGYASDADEYPDSYHALRERAVIATKLHERTAGNVPGVYVGDSRAQLHPDALILEIG